MVTTQNHFVIPVTVLEKFRFPQEGWQTGRAPRKSKNPKILRESYMEAPIIAAHVGVDVDLCGGLVGEAHELPGVEGAHDHVARLLELAEGGGRR